MRINFGHFLKYKAGIKHVPIDVGLPLYNQGREFRGGSRGRVQGVCTPPGDDLRFSNTTGILYSGIKNYVVYWC